LPDYLQRPWLTPIHRWWLASSDDAQPHNGVRELIGANMAVRRSVLERVPRFDPELGPGALGLGEDSLFGWQLVEAGFKIGYASTGAAVHHLDVSRLRRNNWLAEARKHGRTEAYQQYHWNGLDIKNPRSKSLWLGMKLISRRLLQRPPALQEEGCSLWEMSYVQDLAFCTQFSREHQRPRNYVRRGLTRRDNDSVSVKE
jgi:GT2 family glycosyltransferase